MSVSFPLDQFQQPGRRYDANVIAQLLHNVLQIAGSHVPGKNIDIEEARPSRRPLDQTQGPPGMCSQAKILINQHARTLAPGGTNSPSAAENAAQSMRDKPRSEQFLQSGIEKFHAEPAQEALAVEDL